MWDAYSLLSLVWFIQLLSSSIPDTEGNEQKPPLLLPHQPLTQSLEGFFNYLGALLINLSTASQERIITTGLIILLTLIFYQYISIDCNSNDIIDII